MKVTEISINGQPYKLVFGGAALSSVAKELKKTGLLEILKVDTSEGDGAPKQTVDDVIDNACIMAYAGIENWCIINDEKNKFNSANHLKAHIATFNELLPAITAYTEASSVFFKNISEDNSEGEEKGATVTAPNPLPLQE